MERVNLIREDDGASMRCVESRDTTPRTSQIGPLRRRVVSLTDMPTPQPLNADFSRDDFGLHSITGVAMV